MSDQECVFLKGKKCLALTERKCKLCHFMKTREELEAGREKAEDRINRTFTPEEKYAILRKYYSGKDKFRI